MDTDEPEQKMANLAALFANGIGGMVGSLGGLLGALGQQEPQQYVGQSLPSLLGQQSGAPVMYAPAASYYQMAAQRVYPGAIMPYRPTPAVEPEPVAETPLPVIERPRRRIILED